MRTSHLWSRGWGTELSAPQPPVLSAFSSGTTLWQLEVAEGAREEERARLRERGQERRYTAGASSCPLR